MELDLGGKEVKNDTLVESLLLCGTWMAESRLESARCVLEDYLKKAVGLSKSNGSSDSSSSTAHLTLAEFSADLYDKVVARVNTREWRRAGMAAQERQQELEKSEAMEAEAREVYSKTKGKPEKQKQEKVVLEILAHCRLLRKETTLDQRERDAVEQNVPEFLKLSVLNYIEGLSKLSGGEGSDMTKHVFRLVSIWFKNTGDGGVGGEVKLNGLMATASKKIESYVFVPLTYQLFSRIGAEGGKFQDALNCLIVKMCMDHPHHCVVTLMALANGNKVAGEKAEVSTFIQNVGDGKSDAAQRILDSIVKAGMGSKKGGGGGTSAGAGAGAGGVTGKEVEDGRKRALLISNLAVLTNSYFSLAMAPTEKFHSKKGGNGITLAEACQKGDVALDRCLVRGRGGRGGAGAGAGVEEPPCVLTKPPFLRRDLDYSELLGSERIASFESTFTITETGLHRPKIVICRGELGGLYKQLVKGEDDIRQDAVMEQCFQVSETGGDGAEGFCDRKWLTPSCADRQQAAEEQKEREEGGGGGGTRHERQR